MRIARFPVIVPSVAEIGARFPQYAEIVKNDGRRLHDIITTPENIVRVILATAVHELPAVAGVARLVREEAQKLTSGNRLVGALVCCVMERNGFRKLGRKKSIPAEGFTRGEMYEATPAAPAWVRHP
jgi:hypothetical protein